MYGKTYMESPFFDDPTTDQYGKAQQWVHAGEHFLSNRQDQLILVRYHQNYKWIWLNRGISPNPVQISVAQDLRFWDERLAGVLEPAGYDRK